jgi:hypothetical protein
MALWSEGHGPEKGVTENAPARFYLPETLTYRAGSQNGLI